MEEYLTGLTPIKRKQLFLDSQITAARHFQHQFQVRFCVGCVRFSIPNAIAVCQLAASSVLELLMLSSCMALTSCSQSTLCMHPYASAY